MSDGKQDDGEFTRKRMTKLASACRITQNKALMAAILTDEAKIIIRAIAAQKGHLLNDFGNPKTSPASSFCLAESKNFIELGGNGAGSSLSSGGKNCLQQGVSLEERKWSKAISEIDEVPTGVLGGQSKKNWLKFG